MEILQFLGRFHPVVLHFPIGFLFLGFLMQLLARKPKYTALQGAVGFTIGLGFLSAVVTSLLGYWLSTEGGYEEKLLQQHQWLGIATTICAGIVYWVYQKESLKKIYLPLYSLTVIGLMITGHLGGNITHGSDFLVENAPNGLRAAMGLPPKAIEEEAVIANMDEAFVFNDLVRPIIEKKCVSCHNPGKVKGELLLNTVEGIKKGGKSGPFVVAGNVSESLMCVRVNLPTTEKKHMPPRGKKQLDSDEKALLEWWVEQGADFGKQVLDLEVPEKIKNILDKKAPRESKVYAMDLKPVSERKLEQLRASGIRVFPLAQESPFLYASVTDQVEGIGNTLKKLKGVKENLVKLDLSRSAVNNDLLKTLSQFPHLVHLRLDGTPITDQGLKQLRKLEYLEYLNLYGTEVSDEGIASLEALPNLQQLYLWQTQVSEQGVQVIQASLPQLQIDYGVQSDTIFNDVSLQPPLILADQDLFLDSLEVDLKLNLNNVDIYYTIDGSEPTEQSLKYDKPFVINASTLIKAIAMKEEWTPSDVIEKQFIRVGQQPVQAKLSTPPNERYAANGAKSLIDLVKGTARFTDGTWMGWEKENVIATLDLGTSKPVKGVTISALESTGAWIFHPKGLRVSTSADGVNYSAPIVKEIPTSKGPNEANIKQFQLALEELTDARYVKIEVISNGVNPGWHPGAGKPCWVFLDEIIVE